MKWLLFIIMFALFSIISVSVWAQSYKRNGNTFEQTKNKIGVKKDVKETPYTWKDSKGNEYKIYISSTGSCFVKKISNKTGKEYRHYIGIEASKEICKDLNIEYQGKTTNNQ